MPRATPAALPQELPRTGGDPGPGRLAAGALGVAVLLGGGRRRRDPRRLGRS
jgi:LPXTG-motif cell wall-anchored protein